MVQPLHVQMHMCMVTCISTCHPLSHAVHAIEPFRPTLCIDVEAISHVASHTLLAGMALPCLAVTLAKLQIDTGAPKRKAAASTGHFGERADSAQTAVRLIALSRVLLTKDAAVLSTVAASAHGADLLNQLLAATLRLAVAAGGEASSTLSLTNITTLFNITGSTLLRQSAFEGLFGLPDRISWVDARAVYTALLDALAAVRATPEGAAIESLLMASGTAPNTSPSAVIAAFVAAVEAHATNRLNTAPRLGVESGGSSASSSSNQTTPSAPSPVPLPTPPLPPAAFAIDPTQSLAANLMHLVLHRLGRSPTAAPLGSSERSTIAAAFTEGLSVLMPNDTEARRQELLASNALTALTHQGMAWLWASVVEATSEQVSSVDAVATSIINSCSATAASLFAEAELQAALGL